MEAAHKLAAPPSEADALPGRERPPTTTLSDVVNGNPIRQYFAKTPHGFAFGGADIACLAGGAP